LNQARTAAAGDPARVRRIFLSTSPESLRQQESGAAVLGLAILSGIALAHALFRPQLGAPSHAFFLAIAARFLVLVGEIVALQTVRATSRFRLLEAYAHAAIVVNLTFAFVLTRLSGVPDSHYVVLMLIPVAAAAFQYRVPFVAAVVAAAGVLTFLEVWLSYRPSGGVPRHEVLEAASVVMLYAAVAGVVAVLARALQDEHAALVGHVEELARARADLVREEKLAALGRLSASIAHEIRNPVAMIASALAVAEEAAPGGLPPGELRAIVRSEVSRLERLTGDFLSYARQRPPQRRPYPVSDAIASLADLIQAEASRRGIGVERLAPDEGEALLDPFQIQQALLNLATNALDAAAVQSVVRIGARWNGKDLVFSVENAGPAIAPAAAERIFEPFFSTKPGGTGLGLAIARSIARAHGGDVTLAENQDRLVRFELSLASARVAREEFEVGTAAGR
jgi:signal transduction histidine kinase